MRTLPRHSTLLNAANPHDTSGVVVTRVRVAPAGSPEPGDLEMVDIAHLYAPTGSFVVVLCGRVASGGGLRNLK